MKLVDLNLASCLHDIKCNIIFNIMIVLDTNIIISGFYSNRGASYLIIKNCLLGKIEYCLTPLVALEYIGKVSDKCNNNFLPLAFDKYLIILTDLINKSNLLINPIINRPLLPDNSDDKILECAITGSAEYIITYNIKDFPEKILNQYKIKPIQPGIFLKEGGLI
jgi:putative PIN family toxin of toxin-antitoxin system